MHKSVRTILFLILAAILLPACTRKQGPTPSDTIDTRMGHRGSGVDIIPELSQGNWGTNGDGGTLEVRGEGISNGKYGDRDMVEGLLPSVYFGFDSASVSASERAKLQQAADYLMENPTSGLLIEGHCDWYGTAEYNLALGDRRATSVSDYISTLGVSPSRIETLSKGSLEATSGLSKDQSSQDRRADLIILK